MTLRRLSVLIVLILVSAVVPNEAEAQICDESCAIWITPDGEWVGFGCVTGGGYFVNCQATANSCRVDSCRLSSVTTVDGVVLAVGSSCELQTLVDRIGDYSGEPYIDENYLLIREE